MNAQRPLSGGMPIRQPLRVNPIFEKKNTVNGDDMDDIEKGNIIKEDVAEHILTSQHEEQEVQIQPPENEQKSSKAVDRIILN